MERICMGRCVWREPKGQQPLHSQCREEPKGLVFEQAILALIIDKADALYIPSARQKYLEKRGKKSPEGLFGGETKARRKRRND
jgi:hypothetical protein